MSAKHVATIQEPAGINAEVVICKIEEEPGVYILKTVWYDANGKKEGESIGWKRISRQGLLFLLEQHYRLPDVEVERLLTA